MKRWWIVPAFLGMALVAGQPVLAQSGNDKDEDEDAPYNYALGVGVGLVEAGQTENYFTAALRIRVGRDGDDDQGGRRRDRGIEGYVEPEIGYWESSDDLIEGSDLLLGVNLIGSMPFSRAESFIGVGVGAHFIDSQVLEADPTLDDSETKIGVNAQFGIDLRLSRSLSAFGTGRFDLVQGSAENVQTKVYLGLRARF
ncbi:MAG TPA: hypothetical protein VKM72_00500 [Thermoanaerobaculia bacterium]|nr:hypothetical protein [Thermoanaerobaculia bacterium]